MLTAYKDIKKTICCNNITPHQGETTQSTTCSGTVERNTQQNEGELTAASVEHGEQMASTTPDERLTLQHIQRNGITEQLDRMLSCRLGGKMEDMDQKLNQLSSQMADIDRRLTYQQTQHEQLKGQVD